MDTSKLTAASVAAAFQARAKSQGMKGKARDAAALEFVLGAASVALQLFGEKSPEWHALSSLAILVSCRGYSWLIDAQVAK